MEIEQTNVFSKDISLVLIWAFLREIRNQEKGIIGMISKCINYDVINRPYKWYYLNPDNGTLVLYTNINIQIKLEKTINCLQTKPKTRMLKGGFEIPDSNYVNILDTEIKIQDLDTNQILSFYINSRKYIHKQICNDGELRDVIRLCGCPRCFEKTRLRLYYNNELKKFKLDSVLYTKSTYSIYPVEPNICNDLSPQKFVKYAPLVTSYKCERNRNCMFFFNKMNQYRTY